MDFIDNYTFRWKKKHSGIKCFVGKTGLTTYVDPKFGRFNISFLYLRLSIYSTTVCFMNGPAFNISLEGNFTYYVEYDSLVNCNSSTASIEFLLCLSFTSFTFLMPITFFFLSLSIN